MTVAQSAGRIRQHLSRCTTIDPRPRKLSRAQHLALQRDGRRPPTAESHLQTEFGPALWEDPAHAVLLADCSVVVGMHPDQVKPLWLQTIGWSVNQTAMWTSATQLRTGSGRPPHRQDQYHLTIDANLRCR